MSIKQQHDWIVSQLESYAKQLADIRNECPHVKVEHTYGGNMMDGWYKKYQCPECGERWSEEIN